MRVPYVAIYIEFSATLFSLFANSDNRHFYSTLAAFTIHLKIFLKNCQKHRNFNLSALSKFIDENIPSD
jgi:hypothetical protein